MQSIDSASQGLAGIIPDKVANACGCNFCVGSQPSLKNNCLWDKVDDITVTIHNIIYGSLVTRSELLVQDSIFI